MEKAALVDQGGGVRGNLQRARSGPPAGVRLQLFEPLGALWNMGSVALAAVVSGAAGSVDRTRLARTLSMTRPADGADAAEVSALLRAWSAGDVDAFERVLPLVYDELHRMAARYLAGEPATVSLQATGLVNEVCLRLLGWDAVRWQNRQHFFGVSAGMMRRVLVDIARRRQAGRRGGRDVVRVPLDTVDVAATEIGADVLEVDLALDQLAAEDPRKARVVELRFFGGLSVDETAEALGVSARTVHTDWAFARAWLYRALSGAHAR
jgi:RNA polymerase sigma factor (TIGR02999 family)